MEEIVEGIQVYENLFAEDGEADSLFRELLDGTAWESMSHRGGEVPRRVSVQALPANAEGDMPLYRHPAERAPEARPFSAAMARVAAQVERRLGLSHRLNHALIQLYRGGLDFIQEHSDKTLDMAEGSCIVNVSLGAVRSMTLRSKLDAEQRADQPAAAAAGRVRHTFPLPHNSVLRMSLPANARWLHAIRADRRPEYSAESAFAGARISLTFRTIGTFTICGTPGLLIYGRGARAKTRDAARPAVVPDLSRSSAENEADDDSEAARLIAAFGRENKSASMQWSEIYGAGFDCIL